MEKITFPSRIACRVLLFALLPLSLLSCSGRGNQPPATGLSTLHYATNITCERGDGYSIWRLRNPWDTAQVMHSYLLVSDSASAAALPSLTAPCSTIQVPVRKAGIATSVHCGLLDELGAGAAIAGVCEKQYIDLPVVTEGLQAGRIADFGNGMNPNIERIIDVAPEVLLLTPFEHSGGYGRVESLGIPIIECAEYMEVSPLARAEWIYFYAELFGAQAAADSIFRQVETNYLALKAKTQPSADTTSLRRVSLLTEMLYGGQWFVPCGESTMGMMFADAGADYLFADRQGSGSVGLPFEAVLEAAQDAEVWLVKFNGATPLTYRQMAEDYQSYTRFRAFQQRHIWGCDLSRNHFYEQTPFHPDRLLRDLLIILHPELMPGEQTVYYQPLTD